MSAEPAYPYSERPEPLAPSAPDPRYHGTLAPLASSEPSSSTALNEAAESIGTAVGKAVETVQHLPERLQEMKQRFTVIRGRAQRDAGAKTEELKSKAGELKEEAAQRVSLARNRAEHLAHQYPLQTILAMAGLGLLMGIVLRIWRDHAD
jgi:ElaB/YqjD/DUF883 family membrane-anchored ribosome-binding protein